MEWSVRMCSLILVGLLLSWTTGCAVNSYTNPVYVAYSGAKDTPRGNGFKLYPLDVAYEVCDSHILTSDPVKKEWERRGGSKVQMTYVLSAYVDRMYVKHLEDYEFSNAELLVVSEVRDGTHEPVRTVAKYAEDAPINDISLDANNVLIYPPTPYKDTPLEFRVKVIELDEGNENEIKNALDLADVIEKGTKMLFSFALPGGITEGIKAVAAMDKNDIELDGTVPRILPTLTYQLQATASALKGHAWRDEKGVCKTLEEIGVENLDLTPHKSFIIIKDLEKKIDKPEPHKLLRYVNGKLCLNKEADQVGCTEEYTASTYVVIRFEAFRVPVTEAEQASAKVAAHNRKFKEQLEKMEIKPDSLWE